MRRLISIIAIYLCFCCSTVFGQVSGGITPLFARQIEHNPILNESFTNHATFYELRGALLAKGISLRVYHVFNKDFTNYSKIFDVDKKEYVPVTLNTYFKSSRVELGIPLFFSGAVLDPFVVNSGYKAGYTIYGGKFYYNNDASSNTFGLGIQYAQCIATNQSFNLKYWATTSDSSFTCQYNIFQDSLNLGIGYMVSKYDDIRISGPTINFSIYF